MKAASLIHSLPVHKGSDHTVKPRILDWIHWKEAGGSMKPFFTIPADVFATIERRPAKSPVKSPGNKPIL